MAVDFDKFLKQKLKEIHLDEAIYGDYIKGILEDDQEDEKADSLTDVLSGVVVSSCCRTSLHVQDPLREVFFSCFRLPTLRHSAKRFYANGTRPVRLPMNRPRNRQKKWRIVL